MSLKPKFRHTLEHTVVDSDMVRKSHFWALVLGSNRIYSAKGLKSTPKCSAEFYQVEQSCGFMNKYGLIEFSVTGDEGITESPTGYIVADPKDLLIRQLSLRIRVTEEELKKYRSKNDELTKTVAKMSKEMQKCQAEMENLRNASKQQINELEQQIATKKREALSSKFGTVMSLLQSAAGVQQVSEPPFLVPDTPKPETSDAQSQTDELLLGSLAKRDSTGTIFFVCGCIPMPVLVSGFHIDCPYGVAFSDSFEYQEIDAAKSSVDSKSSAISSEDIHRLTGKIATLENEKFVFTTQLKLARNKLENLELLEAQKKILEDRVVILNDMNDCLVKENENLKGMLASKMSSGKDPTEDRRRIVDITLDYKTKLDELRAELDMKTKLLNNQLETNKVLAADLETAKEQLKAAGCKDAPTVSGGDGAGDDEAASKNIENEEVESSVKILHLRMNPLDLAHQEYNEFQGSRKRKTEVESSVKILHLRMNPLDLAHQEYNEFQGSRKRKANVYECDDNLDVSLRKRERFDMTKQITELQYQLLKAEKEKDRVVKIHSDLVKKYRACVTALSGLQIKMKGDDTVQVESIFDPGNYFIFRVNDNGKTISLLETDYAVQWTEQIQESK
ncbi:unnamed protein product [Gongylonema pulchrum]|uniref:PH domain-containing protein n=1 Tax=Gongylonema pulchrum TaxID=637853 RepID=A0A183DUZ2_9BILA|nr:unnamed protein product [Gongylonema pulchrum]